MCDENPLRPNRSTAEAENPPCSTPSLDGKQPSRIHSIEKSLCEQLRASRREQRRSRSSDVLFKRTVRMFLPNPLKHSVGAEYLQPHIGPSFRRPATNCRSNRKRLHKLAEPCVLGKELQILP